VYATNHAIIRRMSRVKVSVTLDPELLGAVDGFVQAHPGQDRSKVIDQALQHWYAQQQDAQMEAQYADGEEATTSEQEAWRAIRRATASRRLRRT
jgi:metal-responsive CopG/Arc/MetJ family transcriptional regulator